MGKNNGETEAMTVAVRQYRVHEVAVLLGISVREVWRLVAKGVLPQPVKIGRCSVWFDSDISEFQMRLRAQRERKLK
jgi:predicted DNA-binding transcriptional regulator AlpA